MAKAEVRELLQSALYWEEGFISKYDNSNIDELLKTLGDRKYKRISALLQKNIKDTYKHNDAIKKLIERCSR